MKLFYLINEPVINYQAGYREAIKGLIGKGDITDCFFYSFHVRLEELGSDKNLLVKDVTAEIAAYRPDAILFAHPGDLDFGESFFTQLQKLLGYKPVYALDERDVYGKFVKKLPRQLLTLSRYCDITFLVCSGGWMFEQFRQNVTNKLQYLPHVCDEVHFGISGPGSGHKQYDIVMIGNLIKSRIPFNSMPGADERIKVAEALYKRHGKRFAVFGGGWERYPFSAGKVSFFEQERVLHCSNMSVGVDHFLSYQQYFSDRLPIALFSGVPHLSWQTPKLDLLFGDGHHIHYFNSVEGSVSKADMVLSGAPDKNQQICRQAVDLIRSGYTENVRMEHLIKCLSELRSNN